MTPRPDLSRLTHNEKDRLIHALLDQVEALRAAVALLREEVGVLRAENKELKRRLGLDSSNSGKPPSSDGYRKKPKPANLREKTGKKSGGQAGAESEDRREAGKPRRVGHHYPAACPGSCGGLVLPTAG